MYVKRVKKRKKWISKCGKFTGYLTGKSKNLKLKLTKRSQKLLAYLNIKRIKEQSNNGRQ